MVAAEIIGLVLIGVQTLQKMQADGRAQSTAEEDAALAAAFANAKAAHDDLQSIDASDPNA